MLDPAVPALNRAAQAWHRQFFALAAARGHSVIASLSYELLAQHCPDAWQQRDFAGAPARTGWVPPSALLSPANADARAWLGKAARAFATLQVEAGLPVRFQVGEPWWWVTADGRICLYDDAAKAAFGGAPVEIADLRQPLDAAQLALLDQAGALLASSTAALVAAVREVDAAAETLLLAYLPTVLDAAMPEARRANLPAGWASPAFDTLQIEAYDWVTGGAEARHRSGVAGATARLGYAPERQHYISGFVLAPDEGPGWRRIDAALDEARARGVAEAFVWALPQVCRDGYIRLPDPPEDEDAMQAFDDVLYPLPLGLDAAVAPEFSTSVTITASGHERRNALWADARLRFDVGPGVRGDSDLATLIAFFRARRGQARGFRLRDPTDCSADAQLLGIGDGLRADFALVKRYGDGEEAQVRRITRPRPETVSVLLDGEPAPGWTLEPQGVVRFAAAPPAGAEVRAAFHFDVPVRFAEDRLEVSGAGIAAGEAPSVPLVEIREAA